MMATKSSRLPIEVLPTAHIMSPFFNLAFAALLFGRIDRITTPWALISPSGIKSDSSAPASREFYSSALTGS